MKRQLLCSLILLLVAFGATVVKTTAAATVPEDRPNVIVVYTDDMRVDDLKFMPMTRELIGQQGVTFRRWYSNNPLCCPFRATALSGQYSHNTGVLGNSAATHGGVKFFDETRTIAPHLQDDGYQTAYIGKYLNGYKRPHAYYIPPGWNEWFVPVDHIYAYNDTTVINHNGVKSTYPDYITDVYAQETNDSIRQFSATGAPFVMYVSHLAPHAAGGERPPVPADRHIGAVTAKDLPRIVYEANVTDKPSWIRSLPQDDVQKVNGRSTTLWRIRRAESLMAVDEAVASMVQTLTETGELDNTVIMFTSDNGFMSGEHRIPSGKIVPYEPSARVPMMARGPGFTPGTVRQDATGTVDIAPTILELTGATIPYAVDGRSVLTPDRDRGLLLEAGAALLGDPRTEREVLRVRREADKVVWTGDPDTRSYVGVVDRFYKYIEYWDGEREFYDLRRDPREQRSLINQATNRPLRGYGKVLKPYKQAVRQLENCAGDTCQTQ